MASGHGGKRAGAGRPPGIPQSVFTQEKFQDKIKINRIIRRLNQLIQGDIEMTSPAVTAALGLLRKVMPDLNSVNHTGSGFTDVSRMTTDELNREYRAEAAKARNSNGADKTGSDTPVVH